MYSLASDERIQKIKTPPFKKRDKMNVPVRNAIRNDIETMSKRYRKCEIDVVSISFRYRKCEIDVVSISFRYRSQWHFSLGTTPLPPLQPTLPRYRPRQPFTHLYTQQPAMLQPTIYPTTALDSPSHT